MILDRREQQTLALMIAEVPLDQIGYELGYEAGGVMSARHKILTKLGARSLGVAAIRAVKSGDLTRLNITAPALSHYQRLVLDAIAADLPQRAVIQRLGFRHRTPYVGMLEELYSLFNVRTTPQLMLAAASCDLV